MDEEILKLIDTRLCGLKKQNKKIAIMLIIISTEILLSLILNLLAM